MTFKILSNHSRNVACATEEFRLSVCLSVLYQWTPSAYSKLGQEFTLTYPVRGMFYFEVLISKGIGSLGIECGYVCMYVLRDGESMGKHVVWDEARMGKHVVQVEVSVGVISSCQNQSALWHYRSFFQ